MSHSLQSDSSSPQSLPEQGRFDTCTGLLTPRYFSALLDRYVVRAKFPQGHPLALLVVEVKNGADLGKRLGPSAVAALMAALAHRLVLAARPGDTAAVLELGQLALALNGVGELRQARAAAGRIACILGQALKIHGERFAPEVRWGIALAETECQGGDDLLGSALLGLHLPTANERWQLSA